MTIKEPASIHMLVQKMAWLAKNQKVLANNIAHADSPQFQVLDLEDFNPKIQKRKGVMQTHVTST